MNVPRHRCCCRLLACSSKNIRPHSPLQVVKAHGWRGALDFHDAANTLHGVLIDYKEEEIYMQVWKVWGLVAR